MWGIVLRQFRFSRDEKPNIKLAALALPGAVRFYLSAVQIHNRLHDSQPQAGAE